MYLSTNDTIYIIVVAVITLSGILANVFLLYLIICRSPKHLSPYRLFLGNTAITQLLLAANILAISPRVICVDLYMVFIYLGPSQFLGPWCSYMLYTSMLHLALNSFISLMLSMIYRYVVLDLSNISSFLSVVICLAGYVIPFSMLLLCLNLEYSTDLTLADELTRHSVEDMKNYTLVVTANIVQPGILWSIFCCSILLLPIYATVYICRWRILSTLNATRSAHSNSTKNNIQRLVKALTFQSLVPMLSVFPPAGAYLLIQFGVLNPVLFGYFVAPCVGIGPLLDPLITIYYVTPYRQFATYMIRKPHVSQSQNSYSSNQLGCQNMSTGFGPRQGSTVASRVID